MLGPAGVVKLWPAGKQLVIGEGLETVLAAATRLPYRGAPLRPAWAMLSDGALARFPVIDGVERLILLADNDRNGAGQAAAEDCKCRWQQAGRRGVRLTARSPRHRFQRHRSRNAGARTMSTGFTAEEFEPDTQDSGSGTKSHGPSTAKQRPTVTTPIRGRCSAPRPITALPAKSSTRSRRRPKPIRSRCCCSTWSISATRSAADRTIRSARTGTSPTSIALLAGDTAKARKGLSAGRIRDFYMMADPEWAANASAAA